MVAANELIQNDIKKYLDLHENKDMLQLITCGSMKRKVLQKINCTQQNQTQKNMAHKARHSTSHYWWMDWLQSVNKALPLM